MEFSDLQFSLQFEACSLDPKTFDHESHLRIAWIHINKFGLEKAILNIQSQLQNYVKHVGAEDKYHHTLTRAAIEIVNQFVERQTTRTFNEFISEFPELKINFKELIKKHYSYDIFNSEKAKSDYLKPDLVPFE